MCSPLPSTSETRGEQAHALCLRLLTARSRSRAELAERMAKHGYPGDVIEAVLGRLTEVGLVNDEDFAAEWVRSRQTHAGKGKRALAAELRTKGVDDEVIASVIAGIDAGAERARAEELVERRLRRETFGAGDDVAGDDVKVMRRLVGMLARRGYSQSMAFAVVSDALAAERERRRV